MANMQKQQGQISASPPAPAPLPPVFKPFSFAKENTEVNIHLICNKKKSLISGSFDLPLVYSIDLQCRRYTIEQHLYLLYVYVYAYFTAV